MASAARIADSSQLLRLGAATFRLAAAPAGSSCTGISVSGDVTVVMSAAKDPPGQRWAIELPHPLMPKHLLCQIGTVRDSRMPLNTLGLRGGKGVTPRQITPKLGIKSLWADERRRESSLDRIVTQAAKRIPPYWGHRFVWQRRCNQHRRDS